MQHWVRPSRQQVIRSIVEPIVIGRTPPAKYQQRTLFDTTKEDTSFNVLNPSKINNIVLLPQEVVIDMIIVLIELQKTELLNMNHEFIGNKALEICLY